MNVELAHQSVSLPPPLQGGEVPSLRVLQVPLRPPSTKTERQDCSRCRNIMNCWSGRENEILLNMLVCRIQRDIERDRSLRLFLKMIRPKLIKTALRMVNRGGSYGSLFTDDLVAEQESVITVVLLKHYVLGDIGHPLHYLFGKPNGAVYRWVLHRINSHCRYYSTNFLYGSTAEATDDDSPHDTNYSADFERKLHRLNKAATGGRVQSAPPLAVTAAPDTKTNDTPLSRSIDQAMRVVEDGVTLSLSEYRVIRFCLTHARDDGSIRILDGLHRFLAAQTGSSRQVATRLFASAERRIIDALGLTSKILRSRGVDVCLIPKYRRERIQRRRGWKPSLSVQEVIDAIRFREAHQSARLSDVAWGYGISLVTLRHFCRRFQGKKDAEIRTELASRLELNCEQEG